MVAGNINDPRSALGPLQYAPDDVIMTARPVKLLFQPPSVNNISDQVERVAVDMVQKVDQQIGIASPRSQVDIGNPDRPVSLPVAVMDRRPSRKPGFIPFVVQQRDFRKLVGPAGRSHETVHGPLPYAMNVTACFLFNGI